MPEIEEVKDTSSCNEMKTKKRERERKEKRG